LPRGQNATKPSVAYAQLLKTPCLDNAAAIRDILLGQLPSQLEGDLDELTQRPLIIRTDGSGIPKEKLEMLPRSDGLHTTEQAKRWLLEQFRHEIQKIGIEKLPLCLVAHHFIPSTAAAWARAEPENSFVRIESLWGLPEGLYWYSHDTFEIDMKDMRAATFPIRKRLRFKGTFVAPAPNGRWIHHEAQPPFDWSQSIIHKQWLFEIARTTKRVAQHDGHAVAVMWFVDNDPRATTHPVLPWYHSESAIGSPKAAPRRKLTMASDFKIETVEDWRVLKGFIRSGRRVERVMLEPKDTELVRNQEFASELARFASANKIVVELAGGILSHAYHILRREGAQVECIDLFGAEEENVEYNKLVRDKIPDFIQRRGETVEIVRLRGEALLTALRQKLVEESFEALDAKSGDELIGELADVQEVIGGICKALQIPLSKVEAERIEKQKRRGGFEKGIMLTRTSTPHSLAPEKEADSTTLMFSSESQEDTIDRPLQIPRNRPYSRPDLRSNDQQPEGILTFEAEMNRIGTTEYSTVFEIPIDREDFRHFKLAVTLTRNRATLWSQVRLRLEPTQIPIKLDQMEVSSDQVPTKAERKE
jgi:predicted house-cleaning noncanonical NTP pyrophosphatase (MazG superfamily)